MFTIMYKKAYLLVPLICFFLLFCCSKEEVAEKCVVKGKIIISNGAETNGVKVTFENASDPSLKYIAVSDANGVFELQDVIPGTYCVDAIKEGTEWYWMKDGKYTNQRDRLVNLASGQTKELIIYLKGESYSSEFHLDITDINGNPIGNEIYIPKYTTTIAFRLYNGTNYSHFWTVNADYCFISDDIGYRSEYIFSSFSSTSGTLEPGDNIVLIGTINQNIFSISQNDPYYNYSTLDFHSDFTTKREIHMNIEL